jgi:hypothetical protein
VFLSPPLTAAVSRPLVLLNPFPPLLFIIAGVPTLSSRYLSSLSLAQSIFSTDFLIDDVPTKPRSLFLLHAVCLLRDVDALHFPLRSRPEPLCITCQVDHDYETRHKILSEHYGFDCL